MVTHRSSYLVRVFSYHYDDPPPGMSAGPPAPSCPPKVIAPDDLRRVSHAALDPQIFQAASAYRRSRGATCGPAVSRMSPRSLTSSMTSASWKKR